MPFDVDVLVTDAALLGNHLLDLRNGTTRYFSKPEIAARCSQPALLDSALKPGKKKLRASCDRQLRLARQGAAGTSGSRPGGGSEARDYGTGNVEAEEGRRCHSPATLKEISR